MYVIYNRRNDQQLRVFFYRGKWHHEIEDEKGRFFLERNTSFWLIPGTIIN